MYPHERSLVEKLADMPFAIIGVNSDKNLDQIRETVKEKNISWRSFWNGKDGTAGPISTKWNVSSWPTIYIIDGDGRIRFKPSGPARDKAIDKALTELLGEMGHEVDLSDHDDEQELKQQEGDADPAP